jgi:cell wall-associated NlpC family hydrolase
MTRICLIILVAALGSACASSGAVPRPFPTPGGTTAPSPGAPERPGAGTPAPGTSSEIGYAISATALSLRGAPYRNGGADSRGFDCSGFVQYVYAQHGVQMPREVREQFRIGEDVDPRRLEPGDLLFFTTVAPGASHVGIALGGDQFVHAPSSNGVVRVENLSSRYWANRFVGAKRVQ